MATQAWTDELIHAIQNKEKQLFVSDLAVVIKDIYPKALFHFLVLPWKDIDSVYDLSSEDGALLQHMYNLGLKAAGTSGLAADLFDYGYHMKPSKRRLHLHVVSKDYYSSFLTHRYHWNAFNTEFLIKHEYVVEKLRESESIDRPSSYYIMQLLESPLRCNQCSFRPRNFANLKQHLQQHMESALNSTDS